MLGIYFWQKNWGKWLSATAFILLWLLSTTPIHTALTAGLEYQYPAYVFKQTLPQHTAIVLLG
ncbi:MAG: YdcF family protein, partial [Ghiorsea sp.]|nr:YdcF family protein [Ghiorsea sp.]